MAAPLVGTQFVVPMLVPPFANCTLPVGPAPLLVVMMKAVSVTLVPGRTEPRLLDKFIEVVAFEIVTESALLELAW